MDNLIANLIQTKLFKKEGLDLFNQIEDKEQIIFDFILFNQKRNYIGFKIFDIEKLHKNEIIENIESFITENQGYINYFCKTYLIFRNKCNNSSEINEFLELFESGSDEIKNSLIENKFGIITIPNSKKANIIQEAQTREKRSYTYEVINMLHADKNKRYRSAAIIRNEPDKLLIHFILKRIKYEIETEFLFHLFQYLGNLSEESQSVSKEIIKSAYLEKAKEVRPNIIKNVFPKIGGKLINKKMISILNHNRNDEYWNAVVNAFDNYPTRPTDLAIIKCINNELDKNHPNLIKINSLLFIFRSEHNWEKFYKRTKYLNKEDLTEIVIKTLQSNLHNNQIIFAMNIAGDFKLDEAIPVLIISNKNYKMSRVDSIGGGLSEYSLLFEVLNKIGIKILLEKSTNKNPIFRENLSKIFVGLNNEGYLTDEIKDEVVSILIEYLDCQEGNIRSEATKALGYFEAKALPGLKKLTEINSKSKNRNEIINSWSSINKIAKAFDYSNPERFIEDYLGDFVVLHKENFIKEIYFKDPIYLDLVQEINKAYSSKLYNSVYILSRKLVENYIRDILRKRFPDKPELIQKPKNNNIKQLGFAEIISNLFKNRTIFLRNNINTNSTLINELEKKINKFRRKANDYAHSKSARETEEDLLEFKELLDIIIRNLYGLYN